jgi:Acyl-CoA dehydrogenase, C-terminal domain
MAVPAEWGGAGLDYIALAINLADKATCIEAAGQLIHHAAALEYVGRPCLKEAAMAKLFASEMAERVCSAATARQRFRGEAHLPRRARVPELRSHRRGPEDPDRACAGIAAAAGAPRPKVAQRPRWRCNLGVAGHR